MIIPSVRHCTRPSAPARIAPALCALLAATLVAGCADWTGGGKNQPTTSVRADELVVEAEEILSVGDDEQALLLLTRAIEENPTLTTAHIRMAEIYQDRGDFTSAERSWRSAADLEPRNFDAQYGHGLSLHLLNRLTEAVRVYLKALLIRPDDFQANLNLATAYFQLSEAQQALPYAERAVAIRPDDGAAHANLGAIYSDLGRHPEAVREYEAAAELMELDARLLLNLANSLGKTQRYTEMVNTLEAVNRIEESAAAWERLGYAHFKLRRYSDAVKSYERALELDSTHYPAHNGLGVCFLNEYLHSDRSNLEARDVALGHLRESLKIKRDQPRIVDWISRYN